MAARPAATSTNRIDPPHNRSGFLRVDQLARTKTISRGEDETVDFSRAERYLPRFTFRFDGAEFSPSGLIAETCSDATRVLHRGSIDFDLSGEQMDSIASLDSDESRFLDHRDPAVVAQLGGVRVD